MFRLVDSYDRVFSYLRLSITDYCNFNCKYCLPSYKKFDKNVNLSLYEIYNLISAFSELGISKVRLTGGEPTIRKDFLDIGYVISGFKNVKSLVFTTNGYKLNKIVRSIKNVGFTGVNISLDSLDKKKFFIITNKNYFNDVIYGIFSALDVGLNVKLNIVLSDFFSFSDFENFYSLLKYKNIVIRFIDQMETISIKRHGTFITSFCLVSFLKRNGWIESSYKESVDGPAVVFEHVDFLGKIGFINPYSNSFCSSCNRLRVSSSGNLFLCLFGGVSYSLKHFLNSVSKKSDLVQFIIDKVKLKSESHFLHYGNFGALDTFSSIGG